MIKRGPLRLAPLNLFGGGKASDVINTHFSCIFVGKYIWKILEVLLAPCNTFPVKKNTKVWPPFRATGGIVVGGFRQKKGGRVVDLGQVS